MRKRRLWKIHFGLLVVTKPENENHTLLDPVCRWPEDTGSTRESSSPLSKYLRELQRTVGHR